MTSKEASIVLTYAVRIGKDNPAIAAATLKDAADDFRAHGLHVLAGRYIARRLSPESAFEAVQMVYVLEVWIRRETEDLGHTVDRSREPMMTSDREDLYFDEGDWVERWLAWEGKRRLALWHGGDE